MKNTTVLLCGRSKSGKDHIGDILCKRLLERTSFFVSKHAIADQLKQEFAFNFDVPLQNLYNEKKKEEYGEKIINYAENYIKPTFGKDFLVKRFIETYISNKENTVNIVTDVRFIEEMKEFLSDSFLKTNKVIPVRIISQYDNRNCGFNLTEFPFDLIYYNIRNDIETDSFIYDLLSTIYKYQYPPFQDITENMIRWKSNN